MTDKYAPEIRSKMMSLVKNKDTKPEIYVRKALHAAGYRFRLQRKDLPGRPDVTLPRYKIAIFIHGCFWHGHNCKRGKRPTTNVDFWTKKLDGNVDRDRKNVANLSISGWTVIIIWQCRVKEETETLLNYLSELRNSRLS